MTSIKTGAIVISWGSSIPGREPRMHSILRDAMDFNRRLQNGGRLEEIRLFVAMAGSSRDTIILMGALDELAKILVDDEFQFHVQKGLTVVRNVNIALWLDATPDSVSDGLTMYARHRGGLQ